jgi:hypothetical protein
MVERHAQILWIGWGNGQASLVKQQCPAGALARVHVQTIPSGACAGGRA